MCHLLIIKLLNRQKLIGAAYMFKKTVFIILCAVLIIPVLTGFAAQPFRLHIIANSDLTEDQDVKQKVRDGVLKLVEEDMKKIYTKEDAKEYISENIGIIEKEAQKILDKNGMPYLAKAYIGRFDFPGRTYMDRTYPAGEYDALRIVLGKGEGKNWWCVMFPPLCLMELDGTAEKKPDESKDNVEYVSFFDELFREIFGN